MKDESSPGYFNRYDVLSMQAHSKLKIPDVVTMFHCDTFEYIMRKFPNLGCCSVNLHLDEDYNCHMGPWIARDYPEKLWEFQEYLNSRSYDGFYTYGSIPLIKEYLQHIKNSVIWISSTKSTSPLLEIRHDNTTWIIHNTVESIDRLKELFKNQNVIKEVYLNMPTSFGVYHLTYVLLSECEGLGKLTRKVLYSF